MKMSLDYLAQTVAHMGDRGFAVSKSEDVARTPQVEGQPGEVLFERVRYTLTRRAGEELVLEGLRYPTGEETYFLEIADYHGLSCFSFELDSWKHRPDRVEFKFYARPDTGLGLAVTLQLPDP